MFELLFFNTFKANIEIFYYQESIGNKVDLIARIDGRMAIRVTNIMFVRLRYDLTIGSKFLMRINISMYENSKKISFEREKRNENRIRWVSFAFAADVNDKTNCLYFPLFCVLNAFLNAFRYNRSAARNDLRRVYRNKQIQSANILCVNMKWKYVHTIGFYSIFDIIWSWFFVSSSPYCVRIVACWSRLKFSENIANPSTIVCIVWIRSDYVEWNVCASNQRVIWHKRMNEWMNGLESKKCVHYACMHVPCAEIQR